MFAHAHTPCILSPSQHDGLSGGFSSGQTPPRTSLCHGTDGKYRTPRKSGTKAGIFSGNEGSPTFYHLLSNRCIMQNPRRLPPLGLLLPLLPKVLVGFVLFG